MHCHPTDPTKLFNKHWKSMSDDIPFKTASSLQIHHLHINDYDLRFYVLYELEILLIPFSKSVTDFGLPSIPGQLLADLQNRMIMEEKNYDRDMLNAELQELLPKMNVKQKEIYNLVIDASNNNRQEILFIYGHGGTGKTFLWKSIITSLRSQGKIVLAVASSGSPDEQDPSNASWINIPSEFCIEDDENGMSNLISFIYDEELLQIPSATLLQQQLIVCPKNSDADNINESILSMVRRQETTYLSSDTATPQINDRGETELLYPIDYLNNLNYPSLPPHTLQLKPGIPVILLRNINLAGGLCNGTRMIVVQMLTKVIQTEIITGTRIGEKVYIPRVNLIYKDPILPFELKRKQFPIKLSYAMTINKSQGQSLNKIGIYLPKPIFGHGQLYVALYRATSPEGLKLLIKQQENKERYAYELV
ncbi:uncharacterized protein [Rutidosis leptorrhynchoides]|uniref:uncharacterized protein n=1 Tax=Rutidosis leptorrhynchoides TaxID=125765 RepID=UPI003A99A409